MEPPKSQSKGSDDKDTLEFKRTETDQQFNLPPEVWEMVFQNLNAHWLRSARLTCSCWNRIIQCSPRLMEKFVLTLTANDFGENRQRVRSLLAIGGGYTRAIFDVQRIGNHSPRTNWLVPLGRTLHTLSLKMSGTLILLGHILRELPYLKSLHVDMDNHSNIDSVPDFRLDKLETLSITCITCADRLLPFFKHMCPPLVVLKVDFNFVLKRNFEQELSALVYGVRNTLKELEAAIRFTNVDALATMEDLCLTRANLYGNPENCLQFIRNQPNLVSLDMTQRFDNMTIQHFNEILSILPNLRTLQARIKDYRNQMSLSVQTSLKLETLCIKYSHITLNPQLKLDLSIPSLPNLLNLSLSRCNLPSHALHNLQQTNVSSLTLHGCRFERLVDLCLFKSLKSVELGNNIIEDITLPEPTEQNRTRCRVSTLKTTGSHQDFLLAVVNLFQNLARFEAGEGVDIQEGFIQELSIRSPRLKELRFSGGTFSPNVPRDAVSRFANLETFYIKCRFDEKNGIAESLRDVRKDVEIVLKT